MQTLDRVMERNDAKATLRMARRLILVPEGPAARTVIAPLDFDARSANELRPQTFDQMVGQQRLKGLLRRIVAASRANSRPLDHILLVGASGTGKTTLGQVIARESGRRVFQVGAPVTVEVFEQLREVAEDGDVVIVDEIHMQVSGDRRGITQAADPEAFFSIMEDRKLITSTGVLDFPAITIIGCTTDAGMLPEPFLGRFPLQPQLDPYTTDDMAVLARHNAASLGLETTALAARIFAGASRANPRQLNQYLRNASSLSTGLIGGELAREVVIDLNATTLDGLTRPMQRMLVFLLCAERTVGGELRYRASVNTIATALGFSRDTKHVSLYVEPWLIERGLVQVSPQGRELTPAGVARARRL